MSEPTHQEKEKTKERMRAALDILQNYVTDDGRFDATALTSHIKRQAKRIAELERQNAILMGDRWGPWASRFIFSENLTETEWLSDDDIALDERLERQQTAADARIARIENDES